MQLVLAKQHADALQTLEREGHASAGEVAHGMMLVPVATSVLSPAVTSHDLHSTTLRLRHVLSRRDKPVA